MNKNIIKARNILDSLSFSKGEVICRISIFDDRIDKCFSRYGVGIFSYEGEYCHIYLNIKEEGDTIFYGLSPLPRKDFISVPVSTIYGYLSSRDTKSRRELEKLTCSFLEDWNEVMCGDYIISGDYSEISIICKKDVEVIESDEQTEEIGNKIFKVESIVKDYIIVDTKTIPVEEVKESNIEDINYIDGKIITYITGSDKISTEIKNHKNILRNVLLSKIDKINE